MPTSSDLHQDVTERVRIYLRELFEEKLLEEEGHFYVSYGSTVLEISVEPYVADGFEDTILTVMAYCVQGVEPDEELLRYLLELNHDLPFGAFSLVGNDVFVSHHLLGKTLGRSNLLATLSAVATVSDDYDDVIAEKYGGQRALDRIRDTGGRSKRRAALST